jgi:hypothetical protein
LNFLAKSRLKEIGRPVGGWAPGAFSACASGGEADAYQLSAAL